MIFSLLLALAGVGVLCALVFNAAVYALPVVLGIWVLQQALQWGMGSVGGIALGLGTGAFTYAAGHLVFETNRSMTLRLVVAMMFVLPAIVAGYSFALALLGIGLHSGFWLHSLAGVGGLIVGVTTLARLIGAGERNVGSVRSPGPGI